MLQRKGIRGERARQGTICNREVKEDLSEVVRPWAAPGCSEEEPLGKWCPGRGKGGAQTAIGREVER